jgi:ribosomal protein S18 acetylase RimI-like enzyme
MDWTIRDATADDRPAINAVYPRASLSNEGDRELLLAHPDVLELTEAELANGRTRVAVIDGRVVGFAQFVAHTDRLELDGLFVDPDHMRRGIARDLVLDAAAIGLADGLGHIEVTGNDHARGFYESMGFVGFGVEVTPLGVTAARLRRASSG